jgi:iron complex transport system substrate-binding protein
MTKPARIASLLSSATEILYGLGVGDRVVAVSHECDYPSDATNKPRATFSRIDSQQASETIDSQVKQQLAVGEPLYEVDWSLLETLRPDLIVTQAQCDVCAVRYRDVIDTVQSNSCFQNTNVVALNPNSLDDVLADIEKVGTHAGEPDTAAQFVHELRLRIDRVNTTTSSLTTDERPRVVCIEWVEPMMLAGNWMPELIEMAGGRCELAVGGTHSSYAKWPDVVAYDPQVIVVAPCGFDLPRSLHEAHSLTEILNWKEMSAVRAGQVYVVDGNAYFNRSGPRLVDSLEILARLFHPSRCDLPLPAEQWDQTVALFDA